MIEKLNKIFGTKHVDINLKDICEGHHKITYKGIQAIKAPFDYVIYQMIIFDEKPDLIIEIGSNKGGAALYYADLLNLIGKGELHTIDINPIESEIVKAHPRIKIFSDGWQNYDLNLAKGFEKVLIIEDASHEYKQTIDTLRKFWPLVTVGSYLIVEDGIVNALGIEKDYNGGPLKAIYEFMEENKNFIIDRKWCDMFGKNATFNVDGYLKRI